MRDPDLPKVTFGIIVLNGEPFTRYCLRSLYPFAHEIIVVEGAAPAAAKVATPDGHSTDGTLETLYRFKAEEDPEDKVVIITREGFWREKDEQSQAYARGTLTPDIFHLYLFAPIKFSVAQNSFSPVVRYVTPQTIDRLSPAKSSTPVGVQLGGNLVASPAVENWRRSDE